MQCFLFRAGRPTALASRQNSLRHGAALANSAPTHATWAAAALVAWLLSALAGEARAAANEVVITPKEPALAEQSLIDPNIRVGVWMPPSQGSNPGWEYVYEYESSVSRKSYRLKLDEILAQSVKGTLCDLFPACLEHRSRPPSGSYDLLVTGSFDASVGILDTGPQGQLGRYRGFGNLTLRLTLRVEDAAGREVTSLSIQELGQIRTGLAWSQGKRAKGAASQTLSTVLARIGPGLRASPDFSAAVAKLKRVRAQPAQLALTADFDDSTSHLPNKVLDAAEQAIVWATIHNEGPGTAYGVRVESRMEVAGFSLSDPVAVGDLSPGEERKVALGIAAPLEITKDHVEIVITANEERGFGARPLALRLTARRLTPPALRIVDVTLDDTSIRSIGNRDGQLSNGEEAELVVRVANDGPGVAARVDLKVSPGVGTGVALAESRFSVPRIDVGAVAEVRIPVSLAYSFSLEDLPLTLEAVDGRGAGVGSASRDVQLPVQIIRPSLSLRTEIFDGNSEGSQGNRDGRANNGETLEIALAVVNRGALSARDVRVRLISPDPAVRILAGDVAFGDIPSDASSAEQRVQLQLPRSLGATTPHVEHLRLMVQIQHADFDPLSEHIMIPLHRIEPLLTVELEPISILQGEMGQLHVTISNRGDLDAEEVEINLRVAHQELDLMTASGAAGKEASFSFRNVPAGGGKVSQIFFLRARRTVEPSIHRVDWRLSQRDFDSLNDAFDVPIVEEAATVVTVPGESEPEPLRRARSGLPAAISFLSHYNGDRVRDAVVRFIFEVQHGSPLMEVRLEHDGRRVALPPPQRLGSGVVRYELDLDLSPGENALQAIAVTRGGQVQRRELALNRETRSGKLWLAAIGINSYEDDDDLRYAHTDAMAITEYYRTELRLPEEQILLLTNEAATLQAISSLLATRLRQLAQPDDTVIIYFAGHGKREEDPTSPSGSAEYLLPHDGRLGDLISTALPFDRLLKLVRRIPAERLIFLLDSCFSGGVGRRTRSGRTTDFLSRIVTAGEGEVIVTASSHDELAEESDKLKHGVFTYYLLEGLRGAADENRDSEIEVDELYRYVSERVQMETKGRQHPQKRSSRLSGKILLGPVR